MDGADLVWNSECVGEPVWVSQEDSWLAGVIQESSVKGISVKVPEMKMHIFVELNSQGKTTTVKLLPRDMTDSEKEKGVENMDDLVHLHEASVLDNVRHRFRKDLIYTKTGPILVALNPFKSMSIYGEQQIKEYHGTGLSYLPPHCFAEAEHSFRSLSGERKSQSIIICGESGAGKTETTKLMLRYLSTVSKCKSSAKENFQVSDRIMKSNPIMEAFGNAKTMKNNNSSRFGKFVRLNYDTDMRISGANISNYLLEKSRTVSQASGERNYHIFYQLCEGIAGSDRTILHLEPASNFQYLNQTGCIKVENVDDGKAFEETVKAMKVVGLSADQIKAIFRLLAAILHLGNSTFKPCDRQGDEGQKFSAYDCESFKKSSSLLGCKLDRLNKALTTKKVVIPINNSVIETPLSESKSYDNRNALAKSLYERLFDWLVLQINMSISPGNENDSHFIGVLDIYGFESLKDNGFEQLFINYANEKLQKLFNEQIFHLEEEAYRAEGIDWNSRDLPNNQPCLDLIEGKPIGIFQLINEECLRMEAGSDQALVNKLKNIQNPCFEACGFASSRRRTCSTSGKSTRTSDTDFVVKHYAGDIIYQCVDFVEKNRDTLYTHVIEEMQACSFDLVQNLFKKQQSDEKGKLQGTVTTKFSKQLSALINTIESTESKFVRCIKSNRKMIPGDFSHDSVLRQLKYAGVIAALEMRRSGYPNRILYNQLIHRFKVLIKDLNVQNEGTDKELIKKLFQNKEVQEHVPDESVAFGKTRLFMKADVLHTLDSLVRSKMKTRVLKIQSIGRMIVSRNRFVTFKAAINRIKATYRGNKTRKQMAADIKQAQIQREVNKLRNMLVKASTTAAEASALLQDLEMTPKAISTMCKMSPLKASAEVLHKLEIVAKKIHEDRVVDSIPSTLKDLAGSISVTENLVSWSRNKLDELENEIENTFIAVSEQKMEFEAKTINQEGSIKVHFKSTNKFIDWEAQKGLAYKAYEQFSYEKKHMKALDDFRLSAIKAGEQFNTATNSFLCAASDASSQEQEIIGMIEKNRKMHEGFIRTDKEYSHLDCFSDVLHLKQEIKLAISNFDKVTSSWNSYEIREAFTSVASAVDALEEIIPKSTVVYQEVMNCCNSASLAIDKFSEEYENLNIAIDTKDKYVREHPKLRNGLDAFKTALTRAKMKLEIDSLSIADANSNIQDLKNAVGIVEKLYHELNTVVANVLQVSESWEAERRELAETFEKSRQIFNQDRHFILRNGLTRKPNLKQAIKGVAQQINQAEAFVREGNIPFEKEEMDIRMQTLKDFFELANAAHDLIQDEIKYHQESKERISQAITKHEGLKKEIRSIDTELLLNMSNSRKCGTETRSKSNELLLSVAALKKQSKVVHQLIEDDICIRDSAENISAAKKAEELLKIAFEAMEKAKEDEKLCQKLCDNDRHILDVEKTAYACLENMFNNLKETVRLHDLSESEKIRKTVASTERTLNRMSTALKIVQGEILPEAENFDGYDSDDSVDTMLFVTDNQLEILQTLSESLKFEVENASMLVQRERKNKVELEALIKTREKQSQMRELAESREKIHRENSVKKARKKACPLLQEARVITSYLKNSLQGESNEEILKQLQIASEALNNADINYNEFDVTSIEESALNAKEQAEILKETILKSKADSLKDLVIHNEGIESYKRKTKHEEANLVKLQTCIELRNSTTDLKFMKPYIEEATQNIETCYKELGKLQKRDIFKGVLSKAAELHTEKMKAALAVAKNSVQKAVVRYNAIRADIDSIQKSQDTRQKLGNDMEMRLDRYSMDKTRFKCLVNTVRTIDCKNLHLQDLEEATEASLSCCNQRLEEFRWTADALTLSADMADESDIVIQYKRACAALELFAKRVKTFGHEVSKLDNNRSYILK